MELIILLELSMFFVLFVREYHKDLWWKYFLLVLAIFSKDGYGTLI